MDDAWIPIILFGSTTIILTVWLYFRFRTRQALQQTVQAAIEKGLDLSPELLASLGQPKQSGDADLRRGINAMALAAAFVILALVVDEADALRPMLGVAAFPGMFGVAYLSLWLFAGKKEG